MLAASENQRYADGVVARHAGAVEVELTELILRADVVARRRRGGTIATASVASAVTPRPFLIEVADRSFARRADRARRPCDTS